MNWTPQQPGRAGVYVYRDRVSIQVLMVRQGSVTDELEAYYANDVTDLFNSVARLNGEWLGPIEP